MNNAIEALLKKEEELRAKATPGPWKQSETNPMDVIEQSKGALLAHHSWGYLAKEDSANAEFIVHAANTSEVKSEIIRMLTHALVIIKAETFSIQEAHLKADYYYSKAQALAEEALK